MISYDEIIDEGLDDVAVLNRNDHQMIGVIYNRILNELALNEQLIYDKAYMNTVYLVVGIYNAKDDKHVPNDKAVLIHAGMQIMYRYLHTKQFNAKNLADTMFTVKKLKDDHDNNIATTYLL